MAQLSAHPTEQQRPDGPQSSSGPEKRGFEFPHMFPRERERPKSAEESVLDRPPQDVQGGVPIPPSVPGAPAASISTELSPLAREVDAVLEEGLATIYATLPRENQDQFRNTGKVLVQKIEVTINQSNLKLKRLIQWLRSWLKIIPGINRFFLEQELKIKSDKIMDIAERERRERML
jgi:hypothetical protein